MFWVCAFLYVLSLEEVIGYSSGPPINDAMCISMTPGHKSQISGAQINPQSFVNVKLEFGTSPKCYSPGGPAISVNLQSFQRNGSNLEIEGVFIQVKKIGTPTQNYGKFQVADNTTLTASACFNNEKSALHHNAPLGTESLSFTWTPPSSNNGNLTFTITLVHEYDEFWINLFYNLTVCSASASSNLSFILLFLILFKVFV